MAACAFFSYSNIFPNLLLSDYSTFVEWHWKTISAVFFGLSSLDSISFFVRPSGTIGWEVSWYEQMLEQLAV